MAYDLEDYLKQCHPSFGFALRRILSELEHLGWQPRIVDVMRTQAEQGEKVKKGYSKTMKSWHVDSTRGTLAHGRTGFDVVFGNAADIVDSRYGYQVPDGFKFWTDLGRVARKHGCAWGGDWKKFKDVSHIQMLFIEMRTQTTGTA